MTRLAFATLDRLPVDARVPAYDRKQPCGVVHLGTGAFHRAHQAAYFNALLAQGHSGWMIRGASLRSPGVADQMNPQDGLFTILVREGGAERMEVVGSIAEVLVARQDPAALVSALAHPDVALVTLTVTEKGYYLDPAIGELKLDDPAVAADIADLNAPVTAPGFLVAGLAARWKAGVDPFTVLSCDNLPDNGRRTKEAVLALAREIDADLAKWIAQTVAFPSSMVDRIVPATTQEDLDNFESATGLRDEALVKTEPFTQWVVEDRFCNRRPALEQVGVQMTDDVAAWEMAKLRLLNGAHSAIAYLGGLAGHRYVHQAIAAPGFDRLINALWDEAQTTLSPIEGFDPGVYRAQLAERFANSALGHLTHQIAMDGSQKLPQRWLNTIRDYSKSGKGVPAALTLAVAGWMHWQSGHSDKGVSHRVDDPLADATAAALKQAGGEREGEVRNLLGIGAIFGEELPLNTPFVEQLVRDYTQIAETSAAHAVAAFCDPARQEG